MLRQCKLAKEDKNELQLWLRGQIPGKRMDHDTDVFGTETW